MQSLCSLRQNNLCEPEEGTCESMLDVNLVASKRWLYKMFFWFFSRWPILKFLQVWGVCKAPDLPWSRGKRQTSPPPTFKGKLLVQSKCSIFHLNKYKEKAINKNTNTKALIPTTYSSSRVLGFHAQYFAEQRKELGILLGKSSPISSWIGDRSTKNT